MHKMNIEYNQYQDKFTGLPYGVTYTSIAHN